MQRFISIQTAEDPSGPSVGPPVPRLDDAITLTPDPERISPMLEFQPPKPLGVRAVTGVADTANAAEDGPAVTLSVLANDIGVANVARVNGAAVTPGSVITLTSGARVTVNADGTLSYAVGPGFQGLGAGQTATDTFTYVGSDGGGSSLAPDGVFNASAINGTNGFVIVGGAAGDRSGYSVSGLGDVNGDGIDDLLIGALSADPNGLTDAGASYVVFGRRGGFGTTLDLSTLNGTNGFVLRGVNPFDFSGAAVRAAGDLNGDGLNDFLIGAPWGESDRGANAGETYLVFGRAGGFGAGLDLSTLNGTNGFVVRGGAANDGAGFAVSSAGDINGDGLDDLIVGARDQGTGDAGASYIVFGQRAGFGAGIDVSALNGTNGFVITGRDGGDRSGLAVSSAGDVNGDGIDDLIIGAPGGDPGGRGDAGEAYVVFGRRGGFGSSLDLAGLNGSNGFTISGAVAGDNAGWSVASAGDLNGDGFGDLVIGALYADGPGRENAGASYVVFGRAGGFGANLDLSALNGTNGFALIGTGALNLTGHSVASAGDVNGDGIDDLLIGAIYADGASGTDAGATYVVFGRRGGFGSTLDLGALNGLTGFVIGGAAAGVYSGQTVSAAGDINGDGIDDLIIGAPLSDPSGRTDAGASYVIYGSRNVTTFTGETTVTVTVTGTNDAPVITSDGGGTTGSVTVAENGAAVTTLTATDPDTGARLTYSIVGGADAARFVIDPTTGALRFVGAPDFEGPTDANRDNVYDVVVQVSDGTATDTQTLVVTVTNVNEAPVITSNGGGDTVSITVVENGAAVTVVAAADPDAGSIRTFSIVGGLDAGRFAIDPATGALTFVGPPDFEAPTDANGDNVYDVVVQVSDGALSDTQTLAVTVANQNEAPVITSNGGGDTGAVSVPEGDLGVTTVTATDPDPGSTRTFSIAGGADAARFTIDPATGALTFVGPPDFEGPTDADGNNVYDVVVQVSDGQLSDRQTLAVTVTDRVEAVVITSDGGGDTATISVAENGSAVTTVTAAGMGANRVFSIVGGADAARFTIDPVTGVMTFVTPPNFEGPNDANQNGVYDVVVQVAEGNLTDTQSLAVTVTNVNEAPVITSTGGGATAAVTVAENTTAVTTVTAQDPDVSPVLTYTIAGGADAALFRINAQTGLLEFIAPPDFETPRDADQNGIYDVVVQVSDGVDVDTQTLTVSVGDQAENITLTGVNGSLRSNEGDPYRFIDADVTFTGPPAGYGGATLQVSGLNQTDDLTVLNGVVDVEGQVISFGNQPIGSLSGGQDGQPLVVTFNANATRAAIEAVVESLGYRSNSDIPVQPHSLSIRITTAAGVTTGPVAVGIDFIANVLNGSAGQDTLSGRRGNDTINGFAGGDFLDGGVGDDTLFGGEGDDFLFGGLNNNTLEGGIGTDTAVYTGEQSDYIYFLGQNGEYVVGRLDGQGQLILRDSLFDIEFLQFSNGTFSVDVIFGAPKPPPDKGGIQICFGGEDRQADGDPVSLTPPGEAREPGKAGNDPLILPGLEQDAAAHPTWDGGQGGAGFDTVSPLKPGPSDWMQDFGANDLPTGICDPDWLF